MVIYLLVPRDVQCPDSRVHSFDHNYQDCHHSQHHTQTLGTLGIPTPAQEEKSCLSNSTCFWIDAKPSLTISDDVIMLEGEYFVLVSVNFN